MFILYLQLCAQVIAFISAGLLICNIIWNKLLLLLIDQMRTSGAEMNCALNTNLEIKINKHHVAIHIATAVAAMTTLPTNQIPNKT